MQAKILIFDIETAPALGDVWGLWQNNVGLNQLRKSGYIMSWAAKWLGQKEIMYADCSKRGERGEKAMLKKLAKLLEEADIVVAHNGDRFDMAWVRGRCLMYGFEPFSPPKQVDTLKEVKKNFRLISNKLEYVAKFLGVKEKSQHKKFVGHELWSECLLGNQEAWKEMEKYNKQDVVVLEEVYLKIRPWMKSHPNVALYGDGAEAPTCSVCGGTHLERRGFAYTNLSKFQRTRCRRCGHWDRFAVNQVEKEFRGNIMRGVL